MPERDAYLQRLQAAFLDALRNAPKADAKKKALAARNRPWLRRKRATPPDTPPPTPTAS